MRDDPATTDVSRRTFVSSVATGAGAMLLGRSPIGVVTATQSRAAEGATAQGVVKSGFATAHDGTGIYFEVHGSADRTILLGPYTAGVPSPEYPPLSSAMPADLQRQWQRVYLDRFLDRYRLIFMDYPGEPKMYTLASATVVRDYLAVADANVYIFGSPG